MAGNSTDSPARNTASDAVKNGAAVAVPVVCGFILLIFLFLAVVLPRMLGRGLNEEERRKWRLNKINKVLTPQSFREWTAKEPEKQAKMEEEEPLCVICLEKLEATSQIRAIECKHLFHKECLDPWFEQHHDDCPLCHKAILPAEKRSKKPWKMLSRDRPHASDASGANQV